MSDELEMPHKSRARPTMRPLLTDASRPLIFPVDAVDHRGVVVPTPIAGEHPLTLYVDKCEVVTLMTLGQAPEALAIGYLRNQRLVSSLDELAAVQVDWETDAVAVTTRRGRWQRNSPSARSLPAADRARCSAT
jgi:FdhD protein